MQKKERVIFFIELLLDRQPLTMHTITTLCACLNATEQTLLYGVLVDLPPAVMGDLDAQQSSRVLVDVAADAAESIQLDRASLQRTTQRAFVAAKEILTQLGFNDLMHVLATLPSSSNLTSNQLTRLILQHLLVSRALPPPTDTRKIALASILPLATVPTSPVPTK